MRTGRGRLKLLFGGGAGFHDADTHMRFDTRCEPRAAGGCDGRPDTVNQHNFSWSGPSLQVVGGVETPIAPRLIAFGGARWLTTSLQAGDTGLGALAGIRAALRAAVRESRRRAPMVQVRLLNGGRRTGELVSISPSEVVLRETGATNSFPLDKVSRVERKTHHVRTGVLWGLAAGFVGGYLASCGGGDEEDCWPEVGALFAGIGAGAGALVGGAVNQATADRRLLYSNPALSVSIAPRVSPSGGSGTLSITW